MHSTIQKFGVVDIYFFYVSEKKPLVNFSLQRRETHRVVWGVH